jgi:hypothetical protein
MVMDRAGFDANSILREYARRVVKSELPLPSSLNVKFFPIDGENVLTPLDVQRMTQCDIEGFRASKEAN